MGIDAPPNVAGRSAVLGANMQVRGPYDPIDPATWWRPSDWTEGLPTGLPFLGAEPPPCSEPDAVPIFTLAGEVPEATSQAKEICAGCPYRQPCADWAISHGERWGIWGGLTRSERQRIARMRKGMD